MPKNHADGTAHSSREDAHPYSKAVHMVRRRPPPARICALSERFSDPMLRRDAL